MKIPVFSDAKLTDVDVAVGPEMKSTGEVLGIDRDLDRAIYKGFLGAGMEIPVCGDVFVSLKDHDKTAVSAEIDVYKRQVQGVRRFAGDRPCGALVQLHSHCAGDILLGLVDEGRDGRAQRREPQAVVDQLSELLGYDVSVLQGVTV